MEKKKILVLVDGSERSLNTIRFISEFAPLRDMQLVLFNVFHKVPDYYWDLSNEPMMAGRAPHMASWEAQNRQVIDQFMERPLPCSGPPGLSVKTWLSGLKTGSRE